MAFQTGICKKLYPSSMTQYRLDETGSSEAMTIRGVTL
jgi:hypothetical protein